MSEGDLFRSAIAGDADAVQALLRRYGPDIQPAIAAKIPPAVASQLDADDVMQVTYLEAFLAVVDHPPATDATFPGWLRQIAENNLTDALRAIRAKRRPPPELRIGGQTIWELLPGARTPPTRAARRNEAKALLHDALAQLPANYRDVITLYELEELPIDEVARRMNRRKGALYMMRARAIERLQAILGSGGRVS